MNADDLWTMTLQKLGKRFPSKVRLNLQGGLMPFDSADECGMIRLIQEIVQACESPSLDVKYFEQINFIFKQENGISKGVGILNATFKQHCRAVRHALTLLN